MRISHSVSSSSRSSMSFGTQANNSLRFLSFLLVAVICLGKSPVEAAKSILFAGDSDIEGWERTNQLYPNSINRGVGGTTCKQWVNRIDRLLNQYQPATVVLVCGENDLAEDFSPSETFANFQKVVDKIAAKGAKTIYMGTKPEPSTKSLHAKYRQYDALIRNYYGENQQSPLVMIDVYPAFVQLGNPNNLYARDRLHLSSNGYGYWNTWLENALDDTSGCLRWESRICKLGSDGNNDDENGNDPTSAPTLSPSSCSDDPSFRFKGRRKQNCAWVGRSPDRRCDKRYRRKELWEYCPEACDDC